MVLNFAHRGSLTEAPENTLSALKKAVDHGAKAVELDVQLTRDQQLVVIHDHKLSRFNRSHSDPVSAYTLKEIKKIDIGSSFSVQYRGEPLATLEEVLEICPRNLLLNIEIKNIPVIYEGIENKLLDCLQEYNRLDNIIISSFDHVALQNIQRLQPDVPLGMLFYYRLLRPWDYVKNCGLTIYSVHPNVVYTNKEMIAAFQDLGCKVYPYTVNKEITYDRLISAGADGVFSNNPQIFSG